MALYETENMVIPISYYYVNLFSNTTCFSSDRSFSNDGLVRNQILKRM